MPSLIRQNRGHHPPAPPRHRRQNLDPNRAPGTHLTFRKRSQIFSLYRFARWHYISIANSLKLPHTTIWSAIKSYTATPRKPISRPPMLNTPLQKRLVTRATINAYHRRIIYEEIAKLEGIQAYRRTLNAAFEKE
jgi:hypothetical protein